MVEKAAAHKVVVDSSVLRLRSVAAVMIGTANNITDLLANPLCQKTLYEANTMSAAINASTMATYTVLLENFMRAIYQRTVFTPSSIPAAVHNSLTASCVYRFQESKTIIDSI